MVGLRYGTSAAAERAGEWARQIMRAAYSASAKLAAEKGAFPLYDKDAYLAGETVRELDADVRGELAEHGIRNALLTSVAPTRRFALSDALESPPLQWFMQSAMHQLEAIKNALGAFSSS